VSESSTAGTEEIGVPLHNDSQETRWIKKFDRIAQIVVVPIPVPEFMVVEALPRSERGEGGFGSTGK
jgi:dUTP pyrophosphatase